MAGNSWHYAGVSDYILYSSSFQYPVKIPSGLPVRNVVESVIMIQRKGGFGEKLVLMDVDKPALK